MTAANNAARIGGGSTISKRWVDLFESSTRDADTRGPEEIIADLVENAGLNIV